MELPITKRNDNSVLLTMIARICLLSNRILLTWEISRDFPCKLNFISIKSKALYEHVIFFEYSHNFNIYK